MDAAHWVELCAEPMNRAPARYNEIRFWSVMLGCDASRISMYDEHGGEHYAIIPMNGGGRSNRERRQQTLEAISQHIQDERDPGEVMLQEATAIGATP